MQHPGRPHQELYHPPLPPSIPLPAINTLITRLTSTINDIDVLRDRLVEGAQNGTMPSWDTLLQRYSLLLGRINALSATITAPPPARHNTAGYPPRPPSQIPVLSQFFLHPLNPLPPNDVPGSESSPGASETFFQAINSMPLQLTSAIGEEKEDGAEGEFSHTHDQLRAMSQLELESMKKRLQDRLSREGMKGKAVHEEIERHADEVDWALRVDEDEEEEERDKEGEQAEPMENRKDEDGDDDDDLFGSDEDESMEDTAAENNQSSPKKAVEQTTRSPREKWQLADFVRFMDTGATP